MSKKILLVLAALALLITAAVSDDKYIEITVKSGDTLQSLAKSQLKDSSKWTIIAKYNNINNNKYCPQ